MFFVYVAGSSLPGTLVASPDGLSAHLVTPFIPLDDLGEFRLFLVTSPAASKNCLVIGIRINLKSMAAMNRPAKVVEFFLSLVKLPISNSEKVEKGWEGGKAKIIEWDGRRDRKKRFYMQGV